MVKDTQGESGTQTVSREKVKTKKPKQYQVIMLNDDYTTMDFVVLMLETIFKKSPAESVQIMLTIHNKGQGSCGIYAKQIAEAKISQVHERAKEAGYPLRCIMEEA